MNMNNKKWLKRKKNFQFCNLAHIVQQQQLAPNWERPGIALNILEKKEFDDECDRTLSSKTKFVKRVFTIRNKLSLEMDKKEVKQAKAKQSNANKRRKYFCSRMKQIKILKVWKKPKREVPGEMTKTN
ncbi:CLUMA_CG004600, isoform A [Clunio marinus]|uniref:CLUMA_CG004600, isoform A n=1 Tax=Clunio marinus TaxID=568069 RepID=A0A1J1HS77_9DIPT|nr:CLUMA_CG004600, isoform A [Clunio marinus]